MVPQLSKEQIKIELRRMVDHCRGELHASFANAVADARSHPPSDRPEGFLPKWTRTLAEREAEADALYAQVYLFIEEA